MREPRPETEPAPDTYGGLVVEHRDQLVVVRMDRGENRFHPDLLSGLESVLDAITSHQEPIALVLTGTGKFFSNGLDVEYMAAHPSDAAATLTRVHALLARMLVLDLPTIAAINGHAFGAGAMLAACCDLAIMRSDRGFFCLPEADLGLPFTAGMNALLIARLSPPVAHRAMTTAHRYTAIEALDSTIVHAIAAEADLLDQATELARPLAGKPRHALGAIKQGMYAHVIEALRSTSAESPEPGS